MPFRCNRIESIVGWSLVPFFWCIVTLSLSHWYPGSGVVLDCIDS